jgi:hypothetical protein
MSNRKIRPVRASRLITIQQTIPRAIDRPDADLSRLPLRELPAPQSDPMLNAHNDYLWLYRLGECSVIVTREFGRWHLSIAHPSRYPTWDELAAARYQILPDSVWMIMTLPPRSEYVNCHRFCFQITETEPPK